MDRLGSLQRNSADGGNRRARSSSAPQGPQQDIRREDPTSASQPRASSPGPRPEESANNENFRPSNKAVRRAQTFASPDPGMSSGIRRRGTTTSFRPRAMTRQATGISLAPSGSFTLAGPQNPVAVAHQHQPYVDPGYSQLNPAYEQPASVRPVWSLAKPMPRVVRPGMVPTVSELNVSQPPEVPITEEDIEKGPEPTLRLDRVGTKLKGVNAEREKRFLERRGTNLSTRQTSSASSRSPHRSDTLAQSGTEPLDMLPGVAEEEEPEHGDLGEAGLGVNGRFDPRPTRPDYEFDDSFSAKTALDTIPEGDDYALFKAYNGLEDEIHNVHTHWSVVRLRFRESLAEFLAVVIQLTIGFCADTAYTVGGQTNAMFTDFAWGFATMIAIYIAGGISGAHLNPVITVVLYIYRGFPKRKIPEYIIAQILGAFVAGFIAYGLYRTQILAYIAAGNNGATQNIINGFVTNLRDSNVDAVTGYFNEFVATAFLVVIVLALGDDENAPPGAGMNALILGLIICVLSQAFSYNTGAALNPSRDLGPRLSLLCMGFGGDRLFGDGWWIYGPIAACVSGGLVGAAIYDICIFTGGESPINYPRKRIWRAGHKAKKRWVRRLHLNKKNEDEGFDEFDNGSDETRSVSTGL